MDITEGSNATDDSKQNTLYVTIHGTQIDISIVSSCNYLPCRYEAEVKKETLAKIAPSV